MIRALRLGFLLAVAASVLAAAGCSIKNAPRSNIQPETYLFVQGTIDTVNHRIHLYWYGTDPDGSVLGYKYRWLYVPERADTSWQPIGWCGKPGVCTDTVFTVLTGDSVLVSATFQIRAFDNANDSDATPAAEQFLLSNQPPGVTITNPLRLTDSTYASVSLKWDVYDPDGGGPGLHYRIWLDGNRAGYDSTDAQSFTVPSPRFLQGGTYQSGLRTVYVQAVDDGGSAGPIGSTSWYVRAPATAMRNNRGRLLVIDDIPSTGPNSTNKPLYDAFYQGVIQSAVPAKLPAGSWSVLRTESNAGMFRTASDFAQTLRQFEAVLWYRGQGTGISSLLQSYQDSLGAWLDGGGRLYVDGLFLVEGLRTPGALSAAFMNAHLGSDFLFNTTSTSLGDSTAGWNNKSTSILRTSVYTDVIRTLIPMPTTGSPLNQTGIRAFGVRDTSTVALWAMAGQLDPPNVGYEVPVGVTVPQLNSGRIVLISLPLRSGSPAPATRILNHVLFDPPPLGLLPP